MPRSQETFDAWLDCAKETLRLGSAGNYHAAAARDAEGQRLWKACLTDGWTRKEGERALEEQDER